ncbi:MAG: hypothetical protein Kow0049_30560 [Stanieria sp.]
MVYQKATKTLVLLSIYFLKTGGEVMVEINMVLFGLLTEELTARGLEYAVARGRSFLAFDGNN